MKRKITEKKKKVESLSEIEDVESRELSQSPLNISAISFSACRISHRRLSHRMKWLNEWSEKHLAPLRRTGT